MGENNSHPVYLFFNLLLFNRRRFAILANDSFIVRYEASNFADHVHKPHRSRYEAGSACLFLEFHPTAVRTTGDGETSACNPECHDNFSHIISPFPDTPLPAGGMIKPSPYGRDCSQRFYWSASTVSRKFTPSSSIKALIESHDRLQTKQWTWLS